MNAEITFFEKSVTYDKFVTDIAARLASFMKEDKDGPTERVKPCRRDIHQMAIEQKEKINQPSEFSDIRSFSSDRSEQITHNDKVAGSSPAGSTDIDVL